MEKKFNIGGMSCAACSAATERAAMCVKGVIKADVNLLSKTLICQYDEKATSPKEIINAIEKIGFTAELAGNKIETGDTDYLNMKIRLYVSVALLVILMYVSMGHMFGAPLPNFFTSNPVVFILIQLILTIPVVIVNRKFYIVGFKALFHKSPNMDTLVALGSSAALVYGIYAFFTVTQKPEMVHNLYFESASMILTLVTVGKFLEERSKAKTDQAVKKLITLAPAMAVIIRDGAEVSVHTSEIVPGDTVVIKPGESIPVDGTVIKGSSSVDQSALTGESIPVSKNIGDTVISASINQNGYMHIQATRVGEETTLSQIIELVRSAGSTKAPIARLADKVSGIFVPIVMSIAFIATLIWLIAGYGIDFALSSGISVLVISCPCALGLATPVAIMVSTGRCAGEGILVKSAEALEILHNIDTVVMDKTGTLTQGKPTVTDIISDTDNFIQIAASLEKGSEHPLSNAITEYAVETSLLDVNNFGALSGKGVYGEINGICYHGGNAAYMSELGADISPFAVQAERLANQGKTVMYFSKNDNIIGIIAVSDKVKDSSITAVNNMHIAGLTTVMLTGDNAVTASAVAAGLNIDRVVSEVMPADKEKVVSELKKDGKKVAMVGDGINDSPALISADVGIAVSDGTDIAIDSADIVLMKNDLNDVYKAILISKKTIRNIKQNLFWAFFYNSLGIPVAAGVLYPFFGITLSPMIAAAAMSLSSLFVVTNALRLAKIKF